MKNKKQKVESKNVTANGHEAAADRQVRPTGTGEFKVLKRSELRPDPNQPRKQFDGAKLQELADSIKAQGVIQPILAQFVPAKYRIIEPDLEYDGWRVIDTATKLEEFRGSQENLAYLFAGEDNLKDCHQIVDGERRWRAAELAGLAEVPVIVRDIEAHRVFSAQWISNQTRENLSHIEEGKSFAEQIAKREGSEPGFNAEKLAKELGIARGTVYNRLTLTRLIPAVLESLAGGKIQSSVAGLIAMIPDPKQQEKLLKEITDEEDWEFPFSYRDVEETIEQEYCKQLKDAPFDVKEIYPDVALKGQHSGPCTHCPNRSGNMKEAFPHIKNLNVCTVPACYAEKCKAHFTVEAQEAERKGQKVLTQKEFKAVKSSYIAGEKHTYAQNNNGTFESLMGKHKPEPILLVTDEGLQKFYPREEAFAAARKNGVRFHQEVDSAKEAEKRQKRDATRDRRSALAEAQLPNLAKALVKVSDKDAWEIALGCLELANHFNEGRRKILHAAAKTPKHKFIALALSLHNVLPSDWNGDWREEVVKVWKEIGVDIVAIDKETEKQAQQEMAATAPEPKQKELLVVKKNKKKKGGAKHKRGKLKR